MDLGETAGTRFKGKEEKERMMRSRPLAEDLGPLGAGFAITMATVAAAFAVHIDGVPSSLPLVVLFLLGYGAIILEEAIDINKSAAALMMGIGCWSLVGPAAGLQPDEVVNKLSEALSEVSEIVFFLVGAMSIVETIDAHQGFDIVTNQIKTRDPRVMLSILSVITFFMSAALDNLTTTIIMISLLGKLIPKERMELRHLMGGVIVIAANAGGAWSPLGDVTTTMLWIGGELTGGHLLTNVFLPSVACLSTTLAIELSLMKNDAEIAPMNIEQKPMPRGANLVFGLGLGGLLFVPVFKSITHLPPYAGMLIALGALWSVTDKLHGEDAPNLKMPAALKRIDLSGTLFFFGILMGVASLQDTGVLTQLSGELDQLIPDETIIATAIGAVSSIIDNVPLVAAAQGMYDLNAHPTDSLFWDLIAYCAGTGGSLLVIGSAAGIAFMGLEKVSFGWYLRRISPSALAGYLSGVAVLVAQNKVATALFGGAAAAGAAQLLHQTPF